MVAKSYVNTDNPKVEMLFKLCYESKQEFEIHDAHGKRLVVVSEVSTTARPGYTRFTLETVREISDEPCEEMVIEPPKLH